MLQVAAASPTPDLSTYLVGAPGTDWLEAPAGPDVIDGPFSAHDWATYVEDVPTERALNRDGFIGGYGRSWQQNVTKDFLEEQVFFFRTSNGAKHTYDAFKLDGKTSKYYKSDFATWDDTIAWGSMFVFDDGDRTFSVQFRKGNLLFQVNWYTTNQDLSSKTLDIARTEFESAPDTLELTSSSQSLPQSAQWAIGLGLIVFVVLVGTVIFVLVRQRRSESPAMATAGLQMSADGAYWWDGRTWRSVATDIPPNAQRSPDGLYWWDGQTWRQTGH
jgi:hypothetical protein